MSSAGIVVLASHGDALLRSQCDTAVWLDQGRVREQGELDTVLANYHASYVRDDVANRMVTKLDPSFDGLPGRHRRRGPAHAWSSASLGL